MGEEGEGRREGEEGGGRGLGGCGWVKGRPVMAIPHQFDYTMRKSFKSGSFVDAIR